MLWDTHMHTHHSGDSDALMPDMIQAAVRQNLDGICFTDHFDYDYPDDPNLFLLDFDSYIKEVRSFQDTCRDRLSIRLGIEVGLQADVSFFYLFHTLYVFIFFCKDTLNICNFQIFRAVFYIEEWKVFLLIPSPPFTTLHP